jgi:hypothetical protein
VTRSGTEGRRIFTTSVMMRSSVGQVRHVATGASCSCGATV